MSTCAELSPAPWVATVFLRGARSDAAPSPAPRNLGRWRILGGGRPRARGRGFPPSSTQICTQPRPHFSSPPEGFLSVICLPETGENCPSGQSWGRSCRFPGPHLLLVKSAPRPQPGPSLPRPFYRPGGVSGGRGALHLWLQLLPDPSRHLARPLKLSPSPGAHVYSHSSKPRLSLLHRVTGPGRTREGQAGERRAALVSTRGPCTTEWQDSQRL